MGIEEMMASSRAARWARTAALAVLLSASTGQAAPKPLFPAGDPVGRKVHSALPVVFSARPSVDGSRRWLPAVAAAPVVVRFVATPTAGDIEALRAAGATVPLRHDGSPRGRGRFVVARASPGALRKMATLPRVERIALDGEPFGAPRPLDGTAAEIQAPAAWRTTGPQGLALTGQGITVCDIDSGIDIFHPMFFRADHGYFAWQDVDGDGAFSPGIDGVDLDGSGNAVPLRVLNGLITTYWDDTPMLGSDDPGYQLGLDWLYADTNNNNQREYGRAAGFDDATAALGEPLLVADDVNGNGLLDLGEKLVALGSSKLALVRVDDDVFRRGDNLIDATIDEDVGHGSGASGVLVGGQRGLGREVGIAPGADLIMATQRETYDREVALTDFCIDEGARVVLHEYAVWIGHFLDGSSELEQLIDQTTLDGVAHINPAGNLSTSRKLYQRAHPAGVETDIEVLAPDNYELGPFTFMGITLLWRDPSRSLEVTLEDPTSFSMAMPSTTGTLYDNWHDGVLVWAGREESSRGTAKLDMYVWSETPTSPPIEPGTWRLRVTDPAPPGSPDLEVVAFVMDELSGWGKGIEFPNYSSEEYLIGWPGTADRAITIAAYTGHGYWGGTPGQRAAYSGRGHRIDGQAILDISAPDDPISAGYRPGNPGRYFVFGGTSGASPHVAGAAALLLQADPSRDGTDVRSAVVNGALADGAVGSAPNDDFGYGKLRIYQSLYGEAPPGGSAPSIEPLLATVSQDRPTNLDVVVADADEPAAGLRIDLDRDYDGGYDEQLTDQRFTVSYPELGTRHLKLRVTDSTGRQATALGTIEVVEPPAAVRQLLVPSGGCACSPAAPHRRPLGMWFAMALLGLGVFRHRNRGRPAAPARVT